MANKGMPNNSTTNNSMTSNTTANNFTTNNTKSTDRYDKKIDKTRTGTIKINVYPATGCNQAVWDGGGSSCTVPRKM